MQRHEIPTHLEVEDKILGALTVRQLLFLAVGLSLSYGLWGLLGHLEPQHHPVPLGLRALQLALAALPALCTLALALVQPAGRPVEEWLLAVLRYTGLPRVCIWRPLPDDKEELVGVPMGETRHGIANTLAGGRPVQGRETHAALLLELSASAHDQRGGPR